MDRGTLKAGAAAISYLGLLATLVGAAYWLLGPPPPFNPIQVIDFAGRQSFDVTLQQYANGDQSMIVQNIETHDVDVVVTLNLGTDEVPATDPLIPTSDGGYTRTTPAPERGGVCAPWDPKEVPWDPKPTERITCRFHLAPKSARSFYWDHSPSWVNHRGSRWAVRTPYVRSGGLSYPIISDPSLAPRLRLTARLPIPPASAVVAGPDLRWDWNNGTADFTSDSLNQIAAPLIIDQNRHRYEEFTTFGIAALLGASLGAALQVVRYFKDHWRTAH